MAWFDPIAIAATAAPARPALRGVGPLRAGRRPEVIDLAVARFVELLGSTCPDVQLDSEIDAAGRSAARRPVRCAPLGSTRLLGTDLDHDDVTRAARADRVRASIPGPTADIVHVTIPTWRPDCAVEIDVIEEVARIYGYSRIEQTVPTSPHPGALERVQQDRRLLRQVVVGLGAPEAMPKPFLAPDDLGRAGLEPTGISITNPLAAEESVLRTSLLPGLLKAVAYNESHRNDGRLVVRDRPRVRVATTGRAASRRA